MNIEQEVLARLKPSPEDEARIQDIVRKLTERVMGTKAASKVSIEPYLVGSIAKDTHLKNPDADLFLLFEPDVPREKLEEAGLAIGREAIGGREHYAEHPYIKGEFMGLRVDIVPAYKIVDSSQKMTAVDRTPFHTEFIKANLAPELRDDIRLLKAFMKGIGAYGADAKTLGFSGYLCELLVVKFGGFKPLLEQAGKWRNGIRLEIGEKTTAKFDAPLTFIDPVDPARNVSSATSQDNMALFMVASRTYLESPTLEFYFPNPIKIQEENEIREMLTERGAIITLTMPTPDLIDDILFPQLKKFERNLAQNLESAGFRTVDSASNVYGKFMVIVIEIETITLPEGILHRGPPVSVIENSTSFLAKWQNSHDALSAPFIKDGCWYVFARRKHTDAIEYLRTVLDGIDAGKDLNRLKNKVIILTGVSNQPEIIASLSAYLDRRMPWQR